MSAAALDHMPAAKPRRRTALERRVLRERIALVIILVIYMVPVLWLARRISRPLRALTHDAQRFSLGGAAAPVLEAGPADVRAVIADASALALDDVLDSAATGDAETLAATIKDAFEAKGGFCSRIMVRDAAWFERRAAENPDPEVAGEPKKLHLYVLEREPTGEEERRLAEKCTGPEHFTVRGDALYLKAPDGLGHSVFANLIARVLKVPGTARNWRTVLALLDMAKAAE